MKVQKSGIKMLNKIVLVGNNKKNERDERTSCPFGNRKSFPQGSLNIPSAEEPFYFSLKVPLDKNPVMLPKVRLAGTVDDSGICVDALLRGLAWVFSVLDSPEKMPMMKSKSPEAALVWWRLKTSFNEPITFAFWLPFVACRDPEPLIAVGRWEGEVSQERKRRGGFGYDPYFLVIPALGKHAAELSAEEKKTLRQVSGKSNASIWKNSLSTIGNNNDSFIASTFTGRGVFISVTYCDF